MDPESPRRLAAFDFDGTLTRRDTLVPFLVFACGRRAVTMAVSNVAPGVVRARLARTDTIAHPRDRAKEALLAQLMCGREAAWLEDAGRCYAELLPYRLRPEMMRQLQWHQDRGHEVVIVSASLLAYLEPFAPEHGVDHVIAVGLEEDADGVLTGNLTGPNVRGPEKENRLRACATRAALTPPSHHSGSSTSLSQTSHPAWPGRWNLGLSTSPARPRQATRAAFAF